MVGDLSTKLGHLFTEEDKQFIIAKESEMWEILSAQVATMSDTTTVMQVITSLDWLQLVAAIGLEKNLLLFKRSQDCWNREELDECTSPKTKLYTGLADTFNDEDYIAVIPSMPSLHGDFSEEQQIEKGEYTMTAAKASIIVLKQLCPACSIKDAHKTTL